MSAAQTPFASRGFISDKRLPLPVSRPDWEQCFDPEGPYPLFSLRGRDVAGTSLLPHGDHFASTTSPPPSGQANMPQWSQGNDDYYPAAEAQHHDFPAEMQPLASEHLGKADGAKARNSDDEVVLPAAHPRSNRKRTLRDEVPQRGERSAVEQDAHTAAEVLVGRVQAAAQELSTRCDAVVELNNTLVNFEAKQALAMAEAIRLQKTKITAQPALKLALAEASDARARLENCSRPRKVLNYLKARWEAGARPLDVAEAERRVGEAVKVLRSAQDVEDRAWGVVMERFNAANAAAYMLRRAEASHASAAKVLAGLEAALARAKAQELRTARVVEAGRRRWARDVRARARGVEVCPLFGAAGVLMSVEDDFCSSSGEQVVPDKKAKRARH